MAQWKPVTGFENIYEVSDDGDVRRVDGFLLSQFISGKGYRAVALYKYGVRRHRYVSHLVAWEFLGQVLLGRKRGDIQVNHKDGDKNNNSVSNLGFVTTSENHDHAARTGLTAKGERNGSAKLTNIDVLAIRAAYGRLADIAEKYGVHEQLIYQIRARKLWQHL